MKKERQHELHLAKVELGWFSVLAQALNDELIRVPNWEEAKKEFAFRGCSLCTDIEDIDDDHKQIDIFGTFCAFTLCWDKQCGYYINYGWACDDYQTDLYAYRVGDFRPYYNEKTRKEWEQDEKNLSN